MLTAAMLCMALNVYHEARSEPIAGQVAVALVTMNRVRASGNSVCEVVYQHKQFSWTNDRFKEGTQKLDPVWRARFLRPTDKKAWASAVSIAESVMGGYIRNFLGKHTRFYHAVYVKPVWRKEKSYVTQIGLHIFYQNKRVTNVLL